MKGDVGNEPADLRGYLESWGGEEGFVQAIEEEEEFGGADGVGFQSGTVGAAEGRKERSAEGFGCFFGCE